jgi:long-chain acyl-CoA synthetase
MSEPPRRLDEIARRLASRRADAVVVEDAGVALTGADLEMAVEAAAEVLRAHGIRPGDRVVVVNENAAALAVLVFALSRIGAWPVLVNARLSAAEIDAIARHCDPRAFACTTAASPAASDHARRLGAGELILEAVGAVALSAVHPSTPEPGTGGGEDVAALIYTSGTTGTPKGVMLSHDNLLFVARTSGALRRVSPGDRVYGVLPISHVFGLASVFLASLYHGARLRHVARFEPGALADALAAGGVSVLQGVPAMYARMLALAAERGSCPAPNLRYVSSGGAPLDLGLKQRVEALWGLPLHNGYGLTETAPTVSTTAIDRPADDDSVGPVVPGAELAIRAIEDGRDLPLGEVGEIWIRGPNVMKGYYRDPDATAAAMTPDGFFRSGDLGRMDGDGNLYVVGRLKELIIRSGFNVYPAQVEGVLCQHPDVMLAAVVGRPSPGGANEDIVAFVQPVHGREVDADALGAFVAERLAPYKRPTRYVVMDELPATAAGKVLKARLPAS